MTILDDFSEKKNIFDNMSHRLSLLYSLLSILRNSIPELLKDYNSFSDGFC